MPGDGSPERWIWDALRRRADSYGELPGVADPARLLDRIESVAEGAVRQGEADKALLALLAGQAEGGRDEIARLCGRLETEAKGGGMAEFAAALENQIQRWRQL